MCSPTTCPKDCVKAAHMAGNDEARDTIRARCVCDPFADRLGALIATGIEQRAATEMLLPECRRSA